MSKIFIIGATGYVGAPLIEAILKKYPEFKATALVRNEAYSAALSSIGVKSVIGDFKTDPDLVTQLASETDIVINTSDSDFMPLIDAILAGVKKGFENTGKRPLLIHTSGTAVNADIDIATGKFREDWPVYDDRNVEQITAIPPTAWHRAVDLKVAQADEAGYVSAYIVCPCTIYGEMPSIIPRNSIQIPYMIKTAVENKKVLYGGDGSNVWNFIHRKDLIPLYLTVIQYALSGKDQGKGFEKFYFATGPEHAWIEVIQKVATILYGKGLTQVPDPVSVTEPALLFVFFGSNSRAISGRALDLGWKPTASDVLDELERDIELTLADITVAGS